MFVPNNNILSFTVTWTMSHTLYVCCYIASLGFLNAGIIHSWPATAIPSIRWKQISRLQQYNYEMWMKEADTGTWYWWNIMVWIFGQCWGPCGHLCLMDCQQMAQRQTRSDPLQHWPCHWLGSDIFCSSSMGQQTSQTVIMPIFRPVAYLWYTLVCLCWGCHVASPTHCQQFTSQKLPEWPTKA